MTTTAGADTRALARGAGAVQALATLDPLGTIPEEEVWLASQKSARTRRAYKLDVAHFMLAVNQHRSGTPALTPSKLLRGLGNIACRWVPIGADWDPTPNKMPQALTRAYAEFVGGPTSVLIHNHALRGETGRSWKSISLLLATAIRRAMEVGV